MSSVNLILMRHGNTFGPGDTPVQVGLKSDLPLVEKGLEQAAIAENHFKRKGYHFNAIYSGDLIRQTKSAEIIAQASNLSPIRASQLNEIDYGAWEGLPPDTIKEKWPSEHLDWEEAAIWPEGIFQGSLDAHLQKLQAWLEILRSHATIQQNILAVTSNGIIRLFLHFSNLNWYDLVKNRALAEYKVKTGHYCELEIDANSLTVKSWNCSPIS